MANQFPTFLTLHCLSVCLTWLCMPSVAFPRLGSHSEPAGGAMVLFGKFPHPVAFYHHFVKRGKPLLMKNVLNLTDYGAFTTWTDEYLSSRYGNEVVELERGRKEDRSQGTVTLPLSTFLKVYHNIDLYMVHTVPKSMQDDVMVPLSLQCGGFQDNLQEAVMWFSGGNTKSVLHYDSVDNINCLLDGEKKIVLIDKIHKDKVEAGGFDQEGSFSLADVDSVDPDRFSGLLEVPWQSVELYKGDCVYIPYRWYHHVYSSPGRNLAVNLWFSHLWWFNKTDCDDIGNDTPLKPISEFKLASSNHQLRSQFLSPFADLEKVSRDVFTDEYRCGSDKEANKLWASINKDGDSTLTWEELYTVDMDELVSRFPQCFDSDGDNEELGDEDIESFQIDDSDRKTGEAEGVGRADANEQHSVDGVMEADTDESDDEILTTFDVSLEELLSQAESRHKEDAHVEGNSIVDSVDEQGTTAEPYQEDVVKQEDKVDDTRGDNLDIKSSGTVKSDSTDGLTLGEAHTTKRKHDEF